MRGKGYVGMIGARSLIEKIALSILDREGIAAIWQLQVVAAWAYRTGHPYAAAAILEIAETVEAAWLGTRQSEVHAALTSL